MGWRGVRWLYRTWNNSWTFQMADFRVVLREEALRILEWHKNVHIFGLPSIFILTLYCTSSFKSSGFVDCFMTQVVLVVVWHTVLLKGEMTRKLTVVNRRKHPFKTVTFYHAVSTEKSAHVKMWPLFKEKLHEYKLRQW